MPLFDPDSLIGYEALLKAAERHGDDEGVLAWVGDLECLVAALWFEMTPEARLRAMMSPNGQDALAGFEIYLEDPNDD